MARISTQRDKELSKKGLLRVTVVANILKLAPKTVYSWKDLTVTTVGNVRYLEWLDVLKKKSKYCGNDLITSSDKVYTKWVEQKSAKPKTVSLPVEIKSQSTAIAKAESVLAKVKQLAKPAPKATLHEFTQTVEDVLDLPIVAEHILKLPGE